jgi:putative phosphoribosyl transferase
MTQTLGRTITISEHALEADLVVPAGAQAIIIFAHGSGSSRHSTRNQYVAQTLNDAGLATLLVDLLTEQEKAVDQDTRHIRFDINLLARRLIAVTEWTLQDPSIGHLKMGYFGSSTGAAAALMASAKLDNIRAIVSRGGRPDLADYRLLHSIVAPVLFVVGGNDISVIGATVDTMKGLSLSKRKELAVIPGAGHLFEESGKMEEVAIVAKKWFETYLLDNGNTFECRYIQNTRLVSLKEKFRLQVRFTDRVAAGSMLATVVNKYGKGKGEAIVIGIPRGGIAVADALAKKLHLPLDIVFPRKLRAPDNPENAVGAVMQDGSIYLNKNVVEELKISSEYLEIEKKEQTENIRRRMSLYRPDSKNYELASKIVILVDDGAATGSTIIAAARWIRKMKLRQLVIALPIAPKQVLPLLQNEADVVEVLRMPSKFETVAQYYRDYSDINDKQIIQIMKDY